MYQGHGFNRGIVQTPKGPQSLGAGLRLGAGGALVAGGNSRNLTYREDMGEDDFDLTPLDRREEALQPQLNAPEIASQAQELEAVLDAITPRELLTTAQQQTIRGPVSKRTLDALRSDEVLPTEAEQAVRQYGMDKGQPTLKFKNLGRTELAASPGEAAPALDALGRELAALTEARRYAAAQAGPAAPFAVNFTGPEPGATGMKLGSEMVNFAAEPTPMIKSPWMEADREGGWIRVLKTSHKDNHRVGDLPDDTWTWRPLVPTSAPPEAIAARRQRQEQSRLDELADVEARMQQARANLAGGQQVLRVAGPGQAGIASLRGRYGNDRLSVAGVDDIELKRLTQRARQLRSLADRPEGNLFGQLEEAPRSAVASTGNAAVAANLEGFRAARAGTTPVTRVQWNGRTGDRRRESSPEVVLATRGEAFPDISETRALSDFSTADTRAARVLADQQRQPTASVGVSGLSPQVEADMRARHLAERLNLVFGTKEKPGVVGVATAGRLADDGSWVVGDSLRPKARGDNRLSPYTAPGPALLRRLAAIAGR